MTDCPDGGALPHLSLEDIEEASGRLRIDSAPPPIPRPRSGAATVHPGDVLYGKLRPYLAKSYLVKEQSYASTELLAIRPSAELDPRYLAYTVQSAPFVGWSVATSEGTKMPRTSWEKIAAFEMADFDRSGQAAIADFLDTETARIDALIAKKRRMVTLAEERLQAATARWWELLAERYGLVSLRRLTDVVEQGWSPVCDSATAGPGEWGVLKTSSVSTGRFLVDKNKRLPEGVRPDLRWAVNDGDVLLTRGSGSFANVGIACVANVVDRHVLLSDLIYRLKLGDADPGFVATCLRSPQTRHEIESSIRADAGQTLKIRSDDLMELMVPSAPLSAQQTAQQKWEGISRSAYRLNVRLRRQAELFQERRQALITAAVTGELEIPGVAA